MRAMETMGDDEIVGARERQVNNRNTKPNCIPSYGPLKLALAIPDVIPELTFPNFSR
jgi:hypothetical protein